MKDTPKIAIIGLGYVGLPLAVALARHFPCIGMDISKARIAELIRGFDRTNEIEEGRLKAAALTFTSDIAEARGADVFIVTVPTPIDERNRPDLSAVMGATRAVASVLERGKSQIVVYESTVYPGVTEDICGPQIEKLSGLKRGVDFFLGYSPERINPGDKEHTVERITKVVAAENPDALEKLAHIYGSATSGGVFRAASIKVAEAAKVIENSQRDINIAFINEATMIFQKLGISVHEVLDAAATKWNFLKFQPGLVGGHCIGVDPYYLSHRAQELGHDPKVILAGRSTNDSMGSYIADCVSTRIPSGSSVLVLGLTFKENVPDLRNSKVVDVITRLKSLGHNVTVHDPLADPHEAEEEYRLQIVSELPPGPFEAIVAAVPHNSYAKMTSRQIAALTGGKGLVADIKGLWRHKNLPDSISRWQL